MGGSQQTTDSSLYATAERSYSPLWLTTVFSPEVDAEFEPLGLHPLERYFATRVAPIGAVSVPVVVATFFNFSAAAVERTIPEIWTRLSPRQLLDAQLAGVGRKLDRALAPLDGTVVAEALALLRRAAESATDHPEGRPLFAGYAALPWPEDRYLQLWHAHYLLREFRGDGHISILASEGLSGLEALLLHIAWTPALGPLFRATRGWTDDEWGGAAEKLRGAGWLSADEQLTLTPAGRAYREQIEARTNDGNAPAYRWATHDDLEKLTTLGATIGKALRSDGPSLLGDLVPAE
jgi:hypothetical protein